MSNTKSEAVFHGPEKARTERDTKPATKSSRAALVAGHIIIWSLTTAAVTATLGVIVVIGRWVFGV